MSIDLTLSPGGPLDFKPGLPPGYTGPILSGATGSSAKTNTVQLVIQELAGDDYSIRLTVGRFLKRIIANGFIRTNGFYCYLALKNGIRKDVGTLGKFHLREDQYICFYTEPTTCKARFEKTNEFRTLDLFYSPALLKDLIPFYPELKAVLNGSSANAFSPKVCWTLPSMKEITNQLLNCPYDEFTRKFYFDLKVRELLYQMLENAYKRKHPDFRFTPWETAKIHEARTILVSHIATKPPTIHALSKQVALNEFKLKAGFKYYFNSGIFEWLLEQKMQHARKLILTTNIPLKEICAMVGYPLTTNFITAFRRRFAVTPGALRRK